MKKVAVVISLSLILLNATGQAYQMPQPDNAPKPSYTHIIIYRTWGSHFVSGNGVASMQSSWTINMAGFNSLAELVKWLNSDGDFGYYGSGNRDKNVRLAENEIVKIYDLSAAKEMKLKLKVEEKSLPKRVEVQSEKWTEKSYIIE